MKTEIHEFKTFKRNDGSQAQRIQDVADKASDVLSAAYSINLEAQQILQGSYSFLKANLGKEEAQKLFKENFSQVNVNLKADEAKLARLAGETITYFSKVAKAEGEVSYVGMRPSPKNHKADAHVAGARPEEIKELINKLSTGLDQKSTVAAKKASVMRDAWLDKNAAAFDKQIAEIEKSSVSAVKAFAAQFGLMVDNLFAKTEDK